MQVILLEKITNLGVLGEVVRVKDGHARNFLIPKGMARRATQSAVAEFEARRVELERAASEKLALAQAAVAKLEGSVIEILQKAGVDGRLFGSVTNADIAQAVGQSIQKAQVRLPEGPLKTVGDHAVQLVVHTDAVATITIRVVGEAV